MIGTLSQMTGAQLNNIYTHKVKKTRTLEKAPFENISWSAAARIAATTLPVLNRLPEAPGHKLPSVEREDLAFNILRKFT